MSDATQPILKAEHLGITFGGLKAVSNFNMTINKGELIGLIGPNGAGKTTTIRMIATLLQPTGGDAVVAGHSVCREPAKVRECITYLPDEAGAYKTMTGKAYLKFMASIFTTDRKQADACVQRAMAMCGLGDRLNEKIGTYSRGMIRKLLLSRAVMTRPKLAILDEPTSGLDVINALEIRKMILQLARDEGMSFLLSSHNMLEIEYVSDRVGIISGGHLMVTGKPEELKTRYGASNLEEVFERVVLQHEVH